MTVKTDGKGFDATGKGFYPEFHALWHLEALGVIDDLTTFESCWWKAASKKIADGEKRVRVVVMDTTVDWAHPNLQGVIDEKAMRDFSGSNQGVKLVRPTDACAAQDETIMTGPTIYGAHGTAVAGLIGARPATVNLQIPERIGLDALPTAPNKDGTRCITLPYAGINPFCTIIPVSLTAAPDPDMVYAALEYVAGLDAQIIVVAAAWDDTDRADKNKQSFDPKEGKWSDVNCLLAAICRDSIVICAAGNAGSDARAYPASLADKIDNLIAVTACDKDGTLLSYAYHPTKGAEGVIATLSTQSERYDNETVLLDPFAAVDPYLKRPEGDKNFPKQRIITLDPRGPRGYNPSVYSYTPPSNGPHLEIGSLYAEFSGTSAATAIAAGLISLAMQSKGKNKGTFQPDNLPKAGELFNLQAALNLF